MYEMEGAPLAPPHQGGQSPGLVSAKGPHQGQTPVRAIGFPVSRTSRSFLRVVPVFGGKSIFTPSASATQEFSAEYFLLFLCPHYIHR